MEKAARRWVSRSSLAYVLGVIWIADGIFQAEPGFFARSFPMGLAQGMMNDPSWMVTWMAAVVSHLLPSWGLFNGIAVAIQVGIGVLILIPATRKAGILLSFPWAAIVWAGGENFGGIFSSFPSLMSGIFPGAVLLYLVVGVIVWPRATPDTTATVAQASKLGEIRLAWMWTVTFSLGAVMTLWWVFPGPIIAAMDWGMASYSSPGFLSSMDIWMDHLALSGVQWEFAAICCAFCVVIASLPWWKHRRTAIVVGALFFATMWIVGESFARIPTGSSTDIGESPLFLLILLSFWPHGNPVLDGSRVPLPERDAKGHSWAPVTINLRRRHPLHPWARG